MNILEPLSVFEAPHYFISGDPHGDFLRFQFFCRDMNTSKDKDVMIILGDAGLNYYLNGRDKKLKKKVSEIDITFLCVKGNHEKYPEGLEGYKEKIWNEGIVFYEEEYPNILFAKDGEIYNINGQKTLVIGGAYSVDKYYRLERGYAWFEDEQLSDEQKKMINKKLENIGWEVDIVLSHTCPVNVEPRHLFLSMIDQSTVDKSMENYLQYIADNLKFKKWYFGHFHGEWKIDNYELMFENIKEFGR